MYTPGLARDSFQTSQDYHLYSLHAQVKEKSEFPSDSGGEQAMGILVNCPNGHVFKVKEKYAGKKGFCPQCTDKVTVQVPDTLSTMSSSGVLHKALDGSNDVGHGQSVLDEHHGESVLDVHHKDQSHSASGSLLNSSLIRSRTTCKRCGAKVPSWFASCSECGEFMEGS